MRDLKASPDVEGATHRAGILVRIVLAVLWAALAGVGMYLLFNGALRNFSFQSTPYQLEQLALAETMLISGAIIILAAAAISFAFKVRWWQAVLVAAPALAYPLSEVGWIVGYIWSMVSFVALVLGATAVVMKMFDLGDDQRPTARP